MGFVSLVFDQDKDGSIDKSEFFFLVEFVVACNYIEAAASNPTESSESGASDNNDYDRDVSSEPGSVAA